jgi:hypothetical protein
MAKAVLGTVRSRAQAELVVDRLKSGGFLATNISVLLANAESAKEFAVDNKTKAPEGATGGATAGAIIGGGLGWLAGIGALAIPGVGPLIAAGPIMAALTGVAVGGAVGGITGALIGLGVPEYEAKRYESQIKGGRALIAVHAEDSAERKRAKEIFESVGAEDISTTGEKSVAASR